MIARIARIIINSFILIVLFIIAVVVFPASPPLAVFLCLAAFDQFEDVYYYIYGKRLFPSWFMPIDLIFELTVVGLGLGMFVYSLIYYSYFETWFFRALLILSIPIVYSAIEDVVMWFQPAPIALEGMKHYVCPKKEVCKKKAFVRRKH